MNLTISVTRLNKKVVSFVFSWRKLPRMYFSEKDKADLLFETSKADYLQMSPCIKNVGKLSISNSAQFFKEWPQIKKSQRSSLMINKLNNSHWVYPLTKIGYFSETCLDSWALKDVYSVVKVVNCSVWHQSQGVITWAGKKKKKC